MKDSTRDRLVLPVVIPLGTLVVVGLAVVGFSRVLLSLGKTAAVGVALLVALGIMAAAVWVSSRREVPPGSIASFIGAVVGVTLLVGGVAVAGIGAGVVGEEAAEGPGPAPGPVIESPPAPAEGECPEGSLLLTASDDATLNGFDQAELTATAGEPIVICFENNDTTTSPHNAAVYVEEGGELLGGTEIASGPVVQVLELEPLEPGAYFFRCDVHPTTMTGTLSVVEGAGGEAGEGTGEAGEGTGGGGATTEIVALNVQFDLVELSLPAETESTLIFDNRDGGIPHNVAIYADDTFTEALFVGEIFPGEAAVEYVIPPLPAGTYAFRCDLHPTMAGTVRVG